MTRINAYYNYIIILTMTIPKNQSFCILYGFIPYLDRCCLPRTMFRY